MTTLAVIDQIDEEVSALLNRISESHANDPSTELIIVNLTDHTFDIQQWRAQANITLFDGFDIYAEIELDFTHLLEEWLSELLDGCPSIPFIEYSRLSEQNFAHGLFQDLKRLHLIDHLLQHSVLEQVIFFGRTEISACVEKLCAHHSVVCTVGKTHSRDHITYRIRPIARTFLLFFFNFFIELSTLFLVRSINWIVDRVKPRPNGIGIYALYPSNWDFDESGPRYRYTHDLYDSIQPPEQAYYLISLLRQNTDALNGLRLSTKALRGQLRLGHRFTVLEGHGSLKDILVAYWSLSKWIRWYRGWKSLAQSKRLDFLSISIAELLTPVKFGILREIPKNIYTELCARNFSATYFPRYLYVPLYELLEGRAVVCGANSENTSIIGIQHGVMFNLQRYRVITSLARICEKGFASMVPDVIAIEGEHVKQMYSSYDCIFDKVAVVGAPRIYWNQKREDATKPAAPGSHNSIIIFGDRYAATRLNELAINLSREFAVIFRCHPEAQELERIEGFIKSPDHQLIIETRTLSVPDLIDLYKPTASICCVSGVSVELAMLGVPVILIKSNLYPVIHPLATGENGIPLLSSLGEITGEIRSLRESPSYKKKRINDGQGLSQRIIEYAGSTATRQLVRLTDVTSSRD